MSKLAVAFKLRLWLKKSTGKFGALQGKEVCLPTSIFSLGCQEVLPELK